MESFCTDFSTSFSTLNKTGGTASADCSVTGQNYGGQVVEPTTIELCADDSPYILETMNEVTNPAAGLPEVLWAVWVLEEQSKHSF